MYWTWTLKEDIVAKIHRGSWKAGSTPRARDNLYQKSKLRQLPLFERRHVPHNLKWALLRYKEESAGDSEVLFSSTSWRWPAGVLSATVLEKKVINSPTDDLWKKPKVERSWAAASCTAGCTSLRRMARENRRMVNNKSGALLCTWKVESWNYHATRV